MTLLFCTLPLLGWAVTPSTTNRFSLFTHSKLEQNNQLRLNWLLSMQAELFSNQVLKLDTEMANSFDYRSVWQEGDSAHSMQDQLYRAWLRLSIQQTDIRLGLQRLNFGSATIIRPLQWFDVLQALDLLESTEGVNAALLKSYFPNNSTLWAWAILADGKLKGYEAVASQDHSIELGGRYQLPVLNTEAAISLHHRKLQDGSQSSSENRLGFDLRLDTFAGWWMETTLSHKPELSAEWELRSMLGADYTFGIGHGLYTVLETGINHSSDDLQKLQSQETMSAVLLNYPLGLLDSVSYLASVAWEREAYTQAIAFRRSYDNLVLELNASYAIHNMGTRADTKAIGILLSYTK